MSINGGATSERATNLDHAGAKRSRHAFRMGVAACVLLTGVLWFVEGYLRYEHTERLYLHALTLPPESARVLLQSAIKTEQNRGKAATPKYLAALAARQEPAASVATYAKAHELDPTNASLGIRRGCRLYLGGRYDEARSCFRQASEYAPKNALPAYLEAAALWPRAEGGQGLSKSLALVARTNMGERRVSFPDPLWFSTLPQDGARYAHLRREIVDECCACLYRYAWALIDYVDNQIARRRGRRWDSGLEAVAAMGLRVASSDPPGTLQAAAGLRMAIEALRRRATIAEDPSELIEERVKLESALSEVMAFESTREARIAADRAKYLFVLTRLLAPGAGLILAVYAAVYAAGKIARIRRRFWAYPHTRSAKAVLAAGSAMLLALLGVTTILQQTTSGETGWTVAMACVWWAVLGGALVFGFIYAGLARPTAAEPATRGDRVVAYITMLRRYYGVFLGLFLIVVCAWIVAHRISVSLYPWDWELLTTGLGAEEAEVAHQALAGL